MKKQVSVWDMLQKQSFQNVSCPACNKLVPKTKLNFHLDSQCSSALLKKTESFVDNTKQLTESQLPPSVKLEVKSDISNKSKNISVLKIKTAESSCNTSGPPLAELSPSVKIEVLDESNNITVKKLKNVQSSFNTSAPWRSNINKRKYSMTSPSKSKKSSFSDTISASVCTKNEEILKEPNQNQIQLQEQLSSEFWDNFDSVNFSDELENSGNKEMKSYDQESYIPYYIANFKLVLEKVLEDDFHKDLFNECDRNYIQSFYSLNGSAQKLYVRLFQRKYKWLRVNQINYPQIAQELSIYLDELVYKNFLNSETQDLELETALNLLSLPEAKTLSKQFNFNGSGKSKSDIVDLLLKHAKQHKSFFFASDKNSISHAILKKVLQVLGPCYILQLEPKQLFTRILMLFSLPTMAEDDEEAAGGQQQQLITLLQVNKGALVFPNYNICRECFIFKTREDLIRYQLARQLENDILNAIEAKEFELAKKLHLQAEEKMTEMIKEGINQRDIRMPFHLRRFTAGHVYIRCMNQGVEALQKLRQYEEAVQLLKQLIKQNDYGIDRRGKWYDRLALNLDQHLKKSEEAADVMIKALNDNHVRVGYRWALLTRAKRMCSSKTGNERLKPYMSEMNDILDAPKVTIQGRLLPRPIPGRRHIFISSSNNAGSNDEDVTVLNVEQLAIEHYKENGYIEGVHGEGSTFISLYTLLFWDIIYDGSIADVFISPYQSHPLDLNSIDFYEQRKDQIDCLLTTIRNLTPEILKETVLSSWTLHYGQTSLVNWEIFADVDHAMGLIQCLGTSVLSAICERLAKDFRFTRSGVPDLVVWNPKTGAAKVVEVKGPGDKLSAKQILWLDYLLKHGADAEVCLVGAVASKKLRRK